MYVEDRPVRKGPSPFSHGSDGVKIKIVLCPAAVCVCPGQEIDRASFTHCFTVRAALGLNVCLFYSMTLFSKLLPRWSREQMWKKYTSPRPIAALFVLIDENLILWKFSLHAVKAKSITAKIHAIILQPRRKYYFSLWLVLSLIFLFTHHHRDMEASTGTRSLHCLSPDERGFPIWYAVKVIWIAVMFLYNMHCQAKTGKHFSPWKLISAFLFITTTTNILHLYEHKSHFREQKTTLNPFGLKWRICLVIPRNL